MINITFELHNPFSNRFRDLGHGYIAVFKHKVFEFQHMFYSGTIAEFIFRIKTREDHAGLELSIGLFGYTVRCELYDSRHWDYDKNSWSGE